MISNDQYYDELSNFYKNKYKNRYSYIESVNNKICKFFKPINQTNILDIGVGDGERAHDLISRLGISKSNYYGLEPSKKMYQKAKKHLLSDNLFNLSLENFENNMKFDYILLLWNVIGHINDLDIFFSKISKLTNQNGYIIFDFNNIFNIKEYGLLNYLKNKILSIFIYKFKFNLTYSNNTTQVNFYTKSFIKKILKKNKIKVQDMYFINYQSGIIENTSHRGQVMMICKYVSN